MSIYLRRPGLFSYTYLLAIIRSLLFTVTYFNSLQQYTHFTGKYPQTQQNGYNCELLNDYSIAKYDLFYHHK